MWWALAGGPGACPPSQILRTASASPMAAARVYGVFAICGHRLNDFLSHFLWSESGASSSRLRVFATFFDLDTCKNQQKSI